MKRFSFILLFLSVLSIPLLAQIEPSIHTLNIEKKTDQIALVADGECIIDRILPKAFGRARLQVHDSQTGLLMYERKLPTEYMLFYTKDYLFLQNNGTLTCYDVRSGEERWKMEMQNKSLLWKNEKYLLMSAPIEGENNYYRIFCYDISSRRLLSAPVIHLWDGIEYIEEAEDGVLYLWSDELYKINIHDGNSCHIKTKTQVLSGKKLASNIGLSIAAVAADVAMAAVTGYALIPIIHRGPSQGLLRNNNISSSHISNLASQILTDQGRHYVADRECVRCLDSTMQVIWETPLPDRRASMSNLTLVGDTLVMANLGMGLLGGHTPRATGRPFIATFDKSDGRCLFYRELADERSMHLQNTVQEGCVASMSNDSLYLLSLRDSLLHTVRWDTLQLGGFREMANEPYYKINSETQRFEALGIGIDCVISSHRDAYRVSIDQDPELQAWASVLYQGHPICNEMRVMIGGKDNHDCWITDSVGTPLYHFAEPMQILSIAPKAILYQSISDKTYQVARWD